MEYVLLALSLAVAVLVVWNRRQVEERVQKVVKEVKKLSAGLPELSEQMDQLEQRLAGMDLESIRHEVARLRVAIEALQEPAPTPEPLASEHELSREQELRSLVERALAVRGLGEIKLLDEDLDLQADELVIRVEGARDGLIVKGRVQIAGSMVRSVHLDDSLRQFP